MMHRPSLLTVRAACAGFGLVVLASCATLNREGTVAPVDGGNVSVRQGAPLVINLAANPTTGYGWVLAGDPGKSVWLIGGPDYTPDPVPEGMMGVGGTTTFRFRALDSGAAKLEFSYRPLQEMSAPAAKVVNVDVTVISAGWQNWF